MIKKILIIIAFFYILTLFQISFLAHFEIFRIIPNFILVAIILINIFEDPRGYFGVYSAVAAGFFLDIFSQDYIGLSILILLAVSFSIKLILKKYVQIPNVKSI